MKTHTLLVLMAVITAFIAISTTSCKKDEEEDKNEAPNYRAAQDNALAEGIFSGIYGQIDRTAKQDSLKMIDSLNCPILTISGTAYPYTFTLDFGVQCLCNDGRIRSGQVVSTITGPYLDSTSAITSTLINYYETINNVDYHVTGTNEVVNLGKNVSGHPCFSVNVTNASITSVHGTITWASQRIREFAQGYDTWLNPFDDVYLITGQSNGTDINGAAYSVNIINPLMIQFGCQWIKSGSIELVNPGYPTITVDYGSGACDNAATVTINGVSYPIVMY